MKHIEKRIILIMGVSGSGKTVIGQKLADSIEKAVFLEGDRYHSRENIDKMKKGIPLNDVDRKPWLHRIGRAASEKETGVIIACSALKRAYREILKQYLPGMKIVYLKGSKEIIEERIRKRIHFMHPDLLMSQFRDLEEPVDNSGSGKDVLICNVERDPGEIIDKIRDFFF